jgi:hypothetical protein
VASAYADAGEVSEASRVAREAESALRAIADANGTAGVLAAVVSTYAVAGQSDEAERVVGTISGPVRRAGALTRMASALAVAGQADEAVLAARDAETAARAVARDRRAGVLVAVASALAIAGQMGGAERVARDAEAAAHAAGAARQQEALLRVAECYDRVNSQFSIPQARRLCAIVLTGPSWHKALPLAGRLEPEGLVKVKAVLTSDFQEKKDELDGRDPARSAGFPEGQAGDRVWPDRGGMAWAGGPG